MLRAAGMLTALLSCVCLCLWLILVLTPCPHPLDGRAFSRCITDRHGELLRLSLTPDQKYRIRISLEEIPPEALAAILEYEDRYFWLHPGVNPLSLLRGAAGMASGGRRMGGSTITMQVARLAYGLKTGSLSDKFRQIWLALHMERHYSKAEILEAYFNLAPYGGNVEGLAAAALIYFHKSASRLNREESAALMLVPQNPVVRRPSSRNTAFLEAARRQWHGRGEYAPLRVFSPAELPFAAPHVCAELLARCTQSDPTELRSTLDFALQRRLESEISRYTARHAAYGLNNAAALLVHWPSMEVRALAGSACFHDATIDGQVDGTRARRSPGSTLKPFIYALGLDQGLIHPQTLLADTPRSFAGYDPENFDRSFRGPVSATAALRASRNVPALSLAARLAHPDLYDFLRRADVRFLSGREHYGLSLVLGGAEMSMREMAALYAMLANGGVWRPLKLSELDAAGRQGSDGEGRTLLSPEAAFVCLKMLEENTPDRLVHSHGGAVLPLRFKTGTSNGFRDAWAAGIFGPYVLVVWMGNFDNTANPLLVGGLAAAPLFTDVARSLAAAQAMRDMLGTPRPGLNLEEVEVCTATGDLDISLCSDTVMTWYIPGVSPLRPSGIFRRIHVDRLTGLRACAPEAGRTEERIWEFWPSDLAAMFTLAGRPKAPPPPFEEACRGQNPQGRPPVIMQPKEGLTFHASLARGGQAQVSLMAHADSDAGRLRWFVNRRYAGESDAGAPLVVQAAPGFLHVLVVDSAGRAAARVIEVRAAP
ncbi:MAG: penicillin-binding protein 1C [Desulfovibrio sp.]|nr:penicillin-binding protein 1C [Desulfovibrio sp.]